MSANVNNNIHVDWSELLMQKTVLDRMHSPQRACWSSGRCPGWTYCPPGSTWQFHPGRRPCPACPCPAAGTGGVQRSWRRTPWGCTVQRRNCADQEGASCGLVKWVGWWVGCWNLHRSNHSQDMTRKKKPTETVSCFCLFKVPPQLSSDLFKVLPIVF